MAADHYIPAGPDVRKLMRSVMADRFPDMLQYEPELRISVLFATGSRVPCLTAYGAPATSDVKITKADERASNPDAPDVRFLIDHSTWIGLNDRRRRAGLAYLLRQLDVKLQPGRGKDDASIRCLKDDYGRPVVKKNPADYVTAGFIRDVEEFGEDSWEMIQLRRIAEDIGQDVFGFVKADDADAASIVNGRVAEIEAHEVDGADCPVAKEVFAALISVGHTPDQARAAIDRVLASGKRPGSVAAFVEAVYNDTEIRKPAGAETVVTLSAGGRSVVMTPGQMDRVADGEGPRPRGKGKRPAIVGAEAGV